MEKFVCLSDATSEDGMMERVNQMFYNRSEAKELLRFDRDCIFISVKEYETCVRKGYCR